MSSQMPIPILYNTKFSKMVKDLQPTLYIDKLLLEKLVNTAASQNVMLGFFFGTHKTRNKWLQIS